MSREVHEPTVVRFGVVPRLEHLAIIVLFLLLLVTGLPQKWPGFGLSRWTIDLFGGIYAARYLHRVAGLVFSALTVIHLSRVTFLVLTRRAEASMALSRQDFRDTIDNLRYYLGQQPRPPRFGRYDYKQKFEYWGLVFGSLVMVVTGLILLFPIEFSRLLPAALIPASKVMHSNEALMALLIIIVWHTYTAHLNPDVFPIDLSIFTGKISHERLLAEHPLEAEAKVAAERASAAASVSSAESDAEPDAGPDTERPS